MKAIIKEELVRKSWSGRSILIKTVIGTKDNIVEKVQNYVSERIYRENSIPVKCFNIEIQTSRGKRVDSWTYKPTYRTVLCK